MTSYDDIFETFVLNCGSREDIPDDDEGKYQMIHNAGIHYTIFVESEDVVFDDENEQINMDLSSREKLIYAYCIKYVMLQNQLEEFEEIWLPFQKEMGFKNYKYQLDGRKETIRSTERKILQILTSIEDNSIM